jgi:hypothetical protein
MPTARHRSAIEYVRVFRALSDQVTYQSTLHSGECMVNKEIIARHF